MMNVFQNVFAALFISALLGRTPEEILKTFLLEAGTLSECAACGRELAF